MYLKACLMCVCVLCVCVLCVCMCVCCVCVLCVCVLCVCVCVCIWVYERETEIERGSQKCQFKAIRMECVFA